MFMTALFIIAKIEKQPKCPPIDEWIKMWYMHTMKYCSAMKRMTFCPLQQHDGPGGY